MNRLTTLRLLTAALALATFASPGLAQQPDIDYIGYAWETGGFPPSAAGDELSVLAVATGADPVFQIDFDVDELTFHMYGLISGGETVLPNGTVVISYQGGYLDLYRDPQRNADWDATPPDTFTDGTLAFHGAFTSLTFYYTPDGNGAYEGYLNGLDGEVIDEVCENCVYTWGGSFTVGAGAQIPDGYDLQIDGVLEIDGAVSDEPAAWGDVKTLYRN